jgi:UDP-N-acetylmuramoyl-tripeptide--D-alanyl-D-alanine ligase
MNPYSVQVICEAMGGELIAGDPLRKVTGGVSTDTRKSLSRALFVALSGERFDGHDFLAGAVESGATAVVVSRVPEQFDPGSAAVIKVGCTLHALQRLARWYRDELGMVVIGITGSNGKTTTKDFTASVLRQRYCVAATAGNLNNHIGVPLTVLAATGDDEVLVVEMGMNHAGEIAPLCEIARPHLGIITNIGTAHIEFLGSKDAIAEEKGALARCLPEVGTLLVPAGCDYVPYFSERTLARTVTVGNGRGMIRAEGLRFDVNGVDFSLVPEGGHAARVQLALSGRHMVNNALLAAGAGAALGLTVEEIVAGLQKAEMTGGRLRRLECGGVTVFDDTYNANPDSMKAAVEALVETPGENGGIKTVVFGAMAELGKFAAEMHLEVGRHAARHGVRVVSVGAAAAGIREGAREAGGREPRHFDDYSEAAEWLKEEVRAGDQVLFKGSRTAAVERVMNQAFPQS